MRTVLHRLLVMVPMFVVVSFGLFLLVDLAPGDAAVSIAGENASREEIQAVRTELGLDRPVVTRYVDWLGNAARGDFGDSLDRNQEVSALIGSKMAPTISLALLALTLAIVLGLGLGLVAASFQGRWPDRLVALFAAGGVALPPFVIGLILVIVLALQRSWFPATGYVPIGESIAEWLRHLILPAIALAWFPAAELARHVRSAVAEVLERDYVVTAWAKGLRFPAVLRRHVLRNAGIPIVTVLGTRLSTLLGGTMVVETVFNIQGLGTLTVFSVQARDVPVVLGIVVLSTAVVLIVNLLVDLSYLVLDPRARA